jgi:hypothetical protein
MTPAEIINGILLEDGTEVRWPVEITDSFTMVIDLGDRVKISGWCEKFDGISRIEVSVLIDLIQGGKTVKNEMAKPPPAPPRK